MAVGARAGAFPHLSVEFGRRSSRSARRAERASAREFINPNRFQVRYDTDPLLLAPRCSSRQPLAAPRGPQVHVRPAPHPSSRARHRSRAKISSSSSVITPRRRAAPSLQKLRRAGCRRPGCRRPVHQKASTRAFLLLRSRDRSSARRRRACPPGITLAHVSLSAALKRAVRASLASRIARYSVAPFVRSSSPASVFSLIRASSRGAAGCLAVIHSSSALSATILLTSAAFVSFDAARHSGSAAPLLD